MNVETTSTREVAKTAKRAGVSVEIVREVALDVGIEVAWVKYEGARKPVLVTRTEDATALLAYFEHFAA